MISEVGYTKGQFREERQTDRVRVGLALQDIGVDDTP